MLGILVSLFTNLSSDSPPRIRLIAKFVEVDYEKVDRLLELRGAAVAKLKTTDHRIVAQRKVCIIAPVVVVLTLQVMVDNQEEINDEQEDEWYLSRLDAGLSALQAADYILAWICMEDDGVG